MELIGRRFGHIRVTEVVGQGGMGDVYGGYDEKLERRVALKVLNADQRLDDEARERLLREARALSKLEHPNICRIHDYIETGDVDLLVLEYIDGRTLHEALYDKLPRSEKLRIAIAIAEVLVKAHRAGIVHRDLKPENVMLTRTGEVKVLDFGLARWLHRARPKSGDHFLAVPPPARVASAATAVGAMTETLVLPAAVYDSSPSSRPELATAVGITLGTPIFMSPEQARGESLTPASDMFSFGLLLQSLFTGGDPHPEGLTAREIILRVARGETLPVQGAPGDVTALINRLKQFAPADRPTALESLERLRFLEDKGPRIVRRALVAAVVLIAALGAWRYTVDLQAERAIAVAARAEADLRRGEAEDLIEFMLGDLRKKLEPVGKLDILDDVGKRAIAYVDSLRPNDMTGDQLARGSKALNQLVEVRIGQGRFGDALELAKRSLQLTQAAVKKSPRDPEVQLAYGTSHFWIGNVERWQRNLPRALEHMKEYSRVTEQLARQHPANETYQLERAYGHSVVATILEERGEYASALREYERTRDVKAERVKSKPDDLERQADLALTLNKIGFVLFRTGELRRAQDYLSRELATLESLVKADPDHRPWIRRVALSHGFNAAVLEAQGDVAGALNHVERETEMLGSLHAFDPANTDWMRNYATAELHKSWLLQSSGRPGDALTAATKAERLMASLIEANGAKTSWAIDHALTLLASAKANFLLGENGRAREAIAAARARIPATDSTDSAIRILAEANLVTGDMLAAAGDLNGARAQWSQGAANIVKTRTFNENAFYQALDARLLLRLGQAAEAAPLLARLDGFGYRHADLMSDRQRYAANATSPQVTSVRLVKDGSARAH